jgi:uncharacterized membrane protein YphA (DoxX/SURF4 family)
VNGDWCGAPLAQLVYWGVLILVVLLHGPGKLSLDAIVWKKMTQA